MMALATRGLMEWAGHLRSVLVRSLAMLPPVEGGHPVFESYLARLDAIERLTGLGTGEDLMEAFELREDLILDIDADEATVMAQASEHMVRVVDRLAHRAESDWATHEKVAPLLARYEETNLRERLQDTLPIETRRKLEAEEEVRRRERE